MRVGTGEMRARRALQCTVLAFAFGMLCGAALAQGLDDEIFNSSAEPGIVLRGRAARLLLARPSFAARPVKQMRRWGLVRSNGLDDTRMLEYVTNSPGGSSRAPTVAFYPSMQPAHAGQGAVS